MVSWLMRHVYIPMSSIVDDLADAHIISYMEVCTAAALWIGGPNVQSKLSLKCAENEQFNTFCKSNKSNMYAHLSFTAPKYASKGWI